MNSENKKNGLSRMIVSQSRTFLVFVLGQEQTEHFIRGCRTVIREDRKNIFRNILQHVKTRRSGWYKPFMAAAAIILCTLLSFCLLQHQDGPGLTSLILIGGIGAIVSQLKFFRTGYLVLLALLTCLERHFIVHYNASFQECGSQALITLNITDKDEILSYISMLNISEYIVAVCFLTAVFLQFRSRFSRPDRPHGSFRKHFATGCGSIFCILLFGACILLPPVRNYVRDWNRQKDFLLLRRQFHFQARDMKPDSPAVHFLVIGESHRKDEFDSIVLQGGSPILTQARRSGTLFEFDDMISYYQQTWFSVFTMLCRRGSGDMSANFAEKGLFALFREAGWKVYYITYQPKNISFTGYDCSVNEASVYLDAREITGEKQDRAFLPVIDRILQKKEQKVLIVLKMCGCHFHYASRYPDDPEHCRYQPAYRDSDHPKYRIEEKQLLVNTYRNAMLYSADFFNEIARRCRDLQMPSFMFFLSDHGIINFDDGKNPFFGAARSNFHIPCLLYANDACRRNMSPEVTAALKRNRCLPAGNDYIFDTMVSLAGIRYPGCRKTLDLTSMQAVPAKDRKVWVWKSRVPYDSLKY